MLRIYFLSLDDKIFVQTGADVPLTIMSNPLGMSANPRVTLKVNI